MISDRNARQHFFRIGVGERVLPDLVRIASRFDAVPASFRQVRKTVIVKAPSRIG